jgi:hypothetical protein
VDIGYSLDLLPGLEIKARGVLFDQGRQGLGLPMGAYVSEELVAPAGPFTCKSTRLGK